MKHGEERRRKEEGMGALPWMPLLDHVKYANCDYVKTVRGSVNPTTVVLVPPSTNHISFDRAYSLRSMGTHRIPRVYSRCPKSVHTARHTRAPTFFSRLYTTQSRTYLTPPFPSSTPLFFHLLRLHGVNAPILFGVLRICTMRRYNGSIVVVTYRGSFFPEFQR